MNTAVRQVGQKLGLQIQSLHQQNISSQSLRAGEAMAVHLAGTSDNSIKKMGPWSTNTFLMYIHKQISVFLKGLLEKNATNIPFHNVAFQPMLQKPTLLTRPARAA